MDNPFVTLLEAVLNRVDAGPEHRHCSAHAFDVETDSTLSASAAELRALITAAGHLPVIWNVHTDWLSGSSAGVISSYLETAASGPIVEQALAELLRSALVTVSVPPPGLWPSPTAGSVGEMRQLEPAVGINSP